MLTGCASSTALYIYTPIKNYIKKVLVIDVMIWLWDGLNADNNVDLKSLEATLTNQIYQ
jgi:hypothetical protein